MKNKRISLAIISSVMALFMFTGCSSYFSRAKSASETIASHNPDVEAVREEIDAAMGERSSGSASYGSRAKRANAATAEEAPDNEAGKSDSNGQTSSQVNVDPTKGRLLIRNVNIQAQTTDFESVRQSVEDKIKELGGYIENSGISGTGKTGSLRSASYTIRVPADKLDALISAVGNNCTITSTNENTTDVTLSYVDTKARLESLRIEQKQLTELLSKATDLDSIIVLQERLTTVRYQIESAESQLRVLENQVTYATLSLRIKEVMEIKPQEEPHVDTYGEKIVKTFKASLNAIGEFFKGLLLVLVAISPVIVPMAIITIVVLTIVFRGVKKRRARAAAAKATAPAQPEVKAEAPAQPADKAEAPAAPAEEKAEEKK